MLGRGGLIRSPQSEEDVCRTAASALCCSCAASSRRRRPVRPAARCLQEWSGSGVGAAQLACKRAAPFHLPEEPGEDRDRGKHLQKANIFTEKNP